MTRSRNRGRDHWRSITGKLLFCLPFFLGRFLAGLFLFLLVAINLFPRTGSDRQANKILVAVADKYYLSLLTTYLASPVSVV